MNELLKKRIKESVDKEALIFLENNFRYFGKITGCDDKYIELLDYKKSSYQIIELSHVKQVEIKGDKDE